MTGRLAAVPPSPGEARRLLDAELADPAYAQSWWDRLRAWLAGLFDGGGTSGHGDLTPLFAVLGALVVAVAALVVWRVLARRRADRSRPTADGVLTETGTTSARYRDRARRHLEAGRPTEALLDAFRAVAAHGDETGAAPASPARTAGALVRALEHGRPDLGAELAASAAAFDAVRYGGADATVGQAEAILALDADLRRAPTGRPPSVPARDLVPPGGGG